MQRLLLFLVIVISIPALAQEDINIGMNPYNAPSPILSEEIWDTLQTDYFSSEIEVARLTVDAESVMSELAPDVEDCAGMIPSQPTYLIQWDRTALEEELPVRFFATSNEDLTLIIREPDGDWHCADDFEDVTYPMIEIPSLRSGDYTIWVGSKTNDSLFTGRLYISIGSHTPLRPPPACCDGLSFSNPAQSATEATISYIEIDEGTLENPDNESGITVSTDIIYRGERGTIFTTELIVYDLETGEEIGFEAVDNRDEVCEASVYPCDAEILRRTTSRRDYSSSSRVGPLIFPVESLNLGNLGETYYLEIVVSVLGDEGELIEVVELVTIGD